MTKYIDAEKIPFYLYVADDAPMEGEEITYKSDIDRMPAADVKPVRWGKWIVTSIEYGWNCAKYPVKCRCSLCGHEIKHKNKSNYCPCCGAKMERSGTVT